jgi:hypothetical protein
MKGTAGPAVWPRAILWVVAGVVSWPASIVLLPYSGPHLSPVLAVSALFLNSVLGAAILAVGQAAAFGPRRGSWRLATFVGWTFGYPLASLVSLAAIVAAFRLSEMLLEFTSLFPMGRAEYLWLFQLSSDAAGGVTFGIVLGGAQNRLAHEQVNRPAAWILLTALAWLAGSELGNSLFGYQGATLGPVEGASLYQAALAGAIARGVVYAFVSALGLIALVRRGALLQLA